MRSRNYRLQQHIAADAAILAVGKTVRNKLNCCWPDFKTTAYRALQ